jgi:hypothetical protein
MINLTEALESDLPENAKLELVSSCFACPSIGLEFTIDAYINTWLYWKAV